MDWQFSVLMFPPYLVCRCESESTTWFPMFSWSVKPLCYLLSCLYMSNHHTWPVYGTHVRLGKSIWILKNPWWGSLASLTKCTKYVKFKTQCVCVLFKNLNAINQNGCMPPLRCLCKTGWRDAIMVSGLGVDTLARRLTHTQTSHGWCTGVY